MVFAKNVIQAAALQRINRLARIANKLEIDDSRMMGLGLHKVYAWQVQDTAQELRRLLAEL